MHGQVYLRAVTRVRMLLEDKEHFMNAAGGPPTVHLGVKSEVKGKGRASC